MPRPRSHSAASTKLRQRATLATRWIVPPLLLSVVLGLIWLFPRGEHTRQQALEQKNDAVATDYLRGLLKQHPEDIEVRSELIQRALSLGNEAGALSLLAPLREAGPEQRIQALLLTEAIQENHLLRATAGSPEHAEAWVNLQKTFEQLLPDLGQPGVDTQWLLSKIRLYLPNQLVNTYHKLATLESGRAPFWLENVAQEALAHGLYRQAAEAYFQAQQASLDPSHRQRYFLAGVKTLQSGNLLSEAIAAAKHHAQPDIIDRDVLLYLTRLSRAAGDNANAEHYVRQLMRMSLLELLAPDWQQVSWVSRMPRHGLTRPTLLRTGNTPGIAFDDEAYTLAYEVFVGNKKLDDALAVAQAALRQHPNQIGWLKRLAQASEWSNHPEEALQAWRRLATQYNLEQGWEGMARLAPSLLADEDLLLLWQRKISLRALSESEWREVQANYERLALPIEGAVFFEKQFARHAQAQLLEQAGYLRHSMGDLAGALVDYRLLASTFGPRPKWAMIEASLLYAQSQLKEAFDALNAARPAATDNDQAYWRILGDLAWNLDQREVARIAYDHRQTAEDWARIDTERLLNLLDPGQTDARLAISRAAWNRSRDLNYFVSALSILLDRESASAAKSLLAELKSTELKAARKDANFLAQRARYFLLIHDWDQARTDMFRAHTLAPSDELKTNLIWLMIDTQNAIALRDILPRWEKNAPGSKALMESVSAGWHALGDTQRALHWLKPVLSEHKNDPVWLTDYADLIDQSGQSDLAWNIRKHAAELMHTRPSGNIDTLLRQLRLSLAFEPVDRAEHKLYRALLAGQKVLPGSDTPERDAQLIDELTYAWFLGSEDDSRARFWHWRRYARKLADPAYLALRAADQREDRDAQQRMLQTSIGAIQPSDHTVAANETGEQKIAEEQAWAAFEGAPANDNLHLQMADLLLANRPAQINLRNEYATGDLSGWRHTLSNEFSLSPQLRMSFKLYDHPGQRYLDYTQDSRGVELQLTLLKDDNRTFSVATGQHWGWQPYTSFTLRDENQWGNWQAGIEANWNTPTDDNSILNLAGMQRRIALEGSYRIEQDLETRARMSHAQILGQDSAQLGTRNQYDMALIWADRRRGGFTAELNAQRNNYSAQTKRLAQYGAFTQEETPLTASDILPASFGRIGFTLGYGLVYQDEYTRAWRPFGSGSIGHHSINGLETGWQLGVAGSVLGNDHLSVYGGQSAAKSGGSSAFGGLFYKWFY